MQNKTSKQLLASILALALCCVMLLGTTFAWFTDTATTAVSSIQSGTLDVDLVDANDATLVGQTLNFLSNGAEKTDILWEPGCTYELEDVYIKNKGNLALKYKIEISGIEGDAKLLEAIDWKVELDGAAIELDTFVGNLAPNTKSGVLKLTGHMDENAGNEYQNLSITGIAIRVIATQDTVEFDSIDNQYDSPADLDFVPVANINELRIALANKAPNILLTEDCNVSDEPLVVDYDVNINGGGYDIYRSNGVSTFSTDSGTTEYTGKVFTVKSGATLTLENVTVDGGAVWTGAVDPTLKRGTVNDGIVATEDLISAEANAAIILREGAVLQNNAGTFAVNLGTRIGATLTLDGGKIINNSSSAGAVWGGRHITVNDGEISYNNSTGLAGAIRMVGKCNLTMNGGKINNNVAVTDGGAIWGYGVNGNTSVYNLNGGEISNNVAGGVGGGIYTGTYSTVNISGDFEICNNTASDSGAMRITNYTIFNMTGGTISGNTSTDNEAYDAFYGWCPRLTITGGELDDNITIAGGHTPTVGGDGINGIVYFNVGTNHNTVNLASQFGEIRFVAVEDSNFGAFNFKPASDYTYTAGDEAKLICMNEGYSTYWDTATGTFRLAAN